MRALLVIADIGGYTKFMKVHRINLAHAQYVVAQLLEAVIDGAESQLKLTKLEGDAAFFYAKLPDTPRPDEVKALGRRILSMRHAFATRRAEFDANRVCTCDGCVQATQLKLKFVAHVGDVAFQKVKRYTELAGVDVIAVHRLLKNSVPLPEYVLMSEPVYERLEDEFRQVSKPSTEDLEGLGEVSTWVLDLESVPQALGPVPSSGLRQLWAWVRLTWRSLPFMLGLRKPCEGFRNMNAVGALPAGAEPSQQQPG